MNKEQEQAFWDTIRVLHELDILSHVMLIGSWAEYLFPLLFETEFEANIRTRDIDFFYRNVGVPNQPIQFVAAMRKNGFLYEVDAVSEVARFYKEDLLEIEFLTKVIGSGSQSSYLIRSLGIKAEGLRVINILDDFATEVTKNGYTVIVPLPAAYSTDEEPFHVFSTNNLTKRRYRVHLLIIPRNKRGRNGKINAAMYSSTAAFGTNT